MKSATMKISKIMLSLSKFRESSKSYSIHVPEYIYIFNILSHVKARLSTREQRIFPDELAGRSTLTL